MFPGHKFYPISLLWVLLSLSHHSLSTPPPSTNRNPNQNQRKTNIPKSSFNLTTAQAVQRQVQQILTTNGTETKPTFFFTNVGPNSFEYRGMFSPGKAPNLDFHKSFADFFNNFPKFPNLQFHTHTVINHRNDAPKPVPQPTAPPRPVTYQSPRTVPVIPTLPPVRIQPQPVPQPKPPRRVQKVRPFTRIKPPSPSPPNQRVNYRQNQPKAESPPPPNAVNVQYYQPEPPKQPNPPSNSPPPPNAINVQYYQPQPPKPPNPPSNPFLYQQQPPENIEPIVYHNPIPQIPIPTPPPSLTHLLQQQPPFDLYRLTIPGTNQPILNPDLGINNNPLNGINNGYQNPFINPIPRIDSPNSIQQGGGGGVPESGNNPFQFPFNFPEYHIVRGQDRAESYPKIFRFEDGRTNIVEFERNKKRFRKRKGERVSGPVTEDNDALSPDRVGRDQFLILHGGFFRQNNNNNQIAKVSERYAERFTSFYYDSNELQDNAASSRTTVTEPPETLKPTSAKPKGFGYRI